MSAKAPRRVFMAKQRCRTALSLMGGRAPSEDGLRRAQAELEKALADVRDEVMAMEVQRAKAARRTAKASKNMRDARGYRRSDATLPGYHAGRVPASKGKRYDPTPPTVNEILRMQQLAPSLRHVQVKQCPVETCGQPFGQRHAPDCLNPYGERMRALTYVLWRGGLRIACEALRLTEYDLHPREGFLYVAKGKNAKAREVVLDDWVWPLLEPWLRFRRAYPPGPLFCVIDGPTAGIRPWGAPDVRRNLHKLAALAGVRRRCAPHQLRHSHAVEMLEEGINLLYISRQLGHAGLAVTDNYFKGLPQSRVVKELRGRAVPRISMLDVLRGESANRPMEVIA